MVTDALSESEGEPRGEDEGVEMRETLLPVEPLQHGLEELLLLGGLLRERSDEPGRGGGGAHREKRLGVGEEELRHLLHRGDVIGAEGVGERLGQGQHRGQNPRPREAALLGVGGGGEARARDGEELRGDQRLDEAHGAAAQRLAHLLSGKAGEEVVGELVGVQPVDWVGRSAGGATHRGDGKAERVGERGGGERLKAAQRGVEEAGLDEDLRAEVGGGGEREEGHF